LIKRIKLRYDNEINQFSSYFIEQVNNIIKIRNRLFQKILLSVVIDTLARVLSKGNYDNKTRFVRFIKECAEWNDCDKISIPMLYHTLDRNNYVLNDNLKKEVEKRFSMIGYGTIHRLNIDPYFNEIEYLIKSSDERKLICNMSHATLFYTYRNTLVHEFREPGHGMEISNNNESPYYLGMNHLDNNRETLELVYSTSFFIRVTRDSIENLKRFLQKENDNPFDYFAFGTPWGCKTSK